MTSHLLPTVEQASIFSAGLESQTSIMVNAYAGCGKTSTIEMLAAKLPSQPSVALAFNVRIKKELERRLPPHFEVKTFNGLGHSAWGKALGKRCEVDDRKVGKIVSAILSQLGSDVDKEVWAQVLGLVKKARHAGLVPRSFAAFKGLIPDTEESWSDLYDEAKLPEQVWKIAQLTLTKCIELSHKGMIDYDDQIYMSALFGGVFPRYNLALVDEAQDLSPLNHRQISKVVGPTGRLIVVGDPKQAIYAFRGADSGSMSSLRKLRPEWITLPLATTFRCPKVVVERQQSHAEGFVAGKANLEGKCLEWAYSKESKAWDWNGVLEALSRPSDDVVILCRNNAPLLKMAFNLIKDGVGCTMIGRDIGKGLVALAKKILPGETPLAECISLVNSWVEREVALAEANEKDDKVASIKDRGECLLAVLEGAQPPFAKDLVSALERLFSMEGGVQLSTIHRSKGLEWPCVIHLDPWRIPSKYARENPAQMEQELNLKYVCETRSKDLLILANLADFHQKGTK